MKAMITATVTTTEATTTDPLRGSAGNTDILTVPDLQNHTT